MFNLFYKSTVALRYAAVVLALIQVMGSSLNAQNSVHIDHRYANTDAQSLIGLPMGSRKTIIDMRGNLKWSQWSIKRRELDSPIGFSDQMDGELAIQPFAITADKASIAFEMTEQRLYGGHYPFVLSQFSAGEMKLEELAFAADPDTRTGVLPAPDSGAHALDLVRLTFTNPTALAAKFSLELSGRNRNLPGHVKGSALMTHAGEDVALLESGSQAEISAKDGDLSLTASFTIPAHDKKVLWLRVPYDWPAAKNSELTPLTNDELLHKAIAQWNGLLARGTQIDLPQKELDDFYKASLAYTLILTEYDAQGDLWVLDGPAVYRQYWGRGEYFQARALEVAGYLEPARESIEHSFHIQNDDGEWDGPPVSGWPAWDNTGGNIAAAWDYYLYTHDKKWLTEAYPHMLAASRWIRSHREETHLEDVDAIPLGARPIRRMISSKCRPEPHPPLQPGEKTYWYGLLPWSYGYSGLPEGHSYSHNFLAAYAVQDTAKAAHELEHPENAQWLDDEFADYKTAIENSIRRSVKLETISPPYLPAMPTYPEGAYSQTFLAVYPTRLYSPEDPLVSGLLTRMERGEKQGLPTNVAWAGPAGVWPGEAMNMAETYLLRGNVQQTVDMMLAALNHTYTTDVFKEEILVDVTLPRACDTPHSKRMDMQGTGDQPEAWGSANYINLLRDILLQERDGTVHLMAGLPSAWIAPGQTVRVNEAPVTSGGVVSYTLRFLSAHHMEMQVTASQPTQFAVHLPVDVKQVAVVWVNGKSSPVAQIISLNATNSSHIAIDLK